MSFEGFAESRFRLVTHAQRHLADRETRFREQPRRLPQPPTRQVSERRRAHQGAEFRRKNRARHRHLAGQRGDAPVPLRLAVYQTDGCANLRIAQRSKPPTSIVRLLLEPYAYRLHKDNINQTSDQRLRAGALAPRFIGQHFQGWLQPLVQLLAPAGDVNQRRKYGEQRVIVAVYDLEGTAGHQCLRPTTAVLQQDWRIRFALDQANDRDGFRFRAVGQDMPVPMGHDHQVAARQRRQLLGAIHSEPGATALDDVETGISVRRQAHCPRRGHLATAVDAPPRLEHIQHVHQRVGFIQTDHYTHFRSPSTQDDRTKNQASPTFTIPSSAVIVSVCQSNAMRTTDDEYTWGSSQ